MVTKKKNDSDLIHWKYIRKYKSPKSGKWVYVYAKKDDHTYLKDLQKWKAKYRTNQIIYEQKGNKAYREGDKYSAVNNWSFSDEYKERAELDEHDIDLLLDVYSDNPISKIAESIDKGKNYIKNLLS